MSLTAPVYRAPVTVWPEQPSKPIIANVLITLYVFVSNLILSYIVYAQIFRHSKTGEGD